MPRKRITGCLVRRCAAVLCLASFLVGDANLPAVAALAARLDGSHEVRVASQEGGFCVVLHHPTNAEADPGMQADHQHGIVCGLLCGFWARPDGEPDHLLAFATGSWCESDYAAEKLLAEGQARVVLRQQECSFCPAILVTPRFCCQILAMLPERSNAPPLLPAALSGRAFQLLI